jgi:hypothetical protein
MVCRDISGEFYYSAVQEENTFRFAWLSAFREGKFAIIVMQGFYNEVFPPVCLF